MICQKCGHENERVLYEPVTPPVSAVRQDGDAAPDEEPVFYKRWACAKCGRHHFADGTLYSNQYEATEIARLREEVADLRAYTDAVRKTLEDLL